MAVSVQTCQRAEDAESILSASRGARVIAGGTLLMRAVNAGDQSLDVLVRLTDPAMREIRNDGGRMVIGSLATMADVMAARDLDFLAQAARSVGGPAVRNMATVGGNLFAESPYGDFTTALLALGASVQVAGESAVATPLEEFLRDRSRYDGRLVRSVTVERPREPEAFRWLKVSRVKPKGIAVMSMAAYLPRSGAPRVAYGNMGPRPVRAEAVERALNGASLDMRGIEGALAVASDGLTPPTDAIASDWYRRAVAPVHLKRLLLGPEGQG